MISGENDLKSILLAMSPLLDDGVVVLINNSSGELWASGDKGAGNRVLDAYSSLSWDLSDQQQRNQLISFCNYSKYIEGASACDDGEISLQYYSPTGYLVHCDRIKYTFIAANCGEQPRTDNGQRARFEGLSASLVRCEWSITDNSPIPNLNYNCIALSAGLTDRWIGKIGPPEYGDEFIDRDYGDRDGQVEIWEVDIFYACHGLYPNANGPADATAMYYSEFHGARKKLCGCGAGKWIMYESKCGPWERIEHVWDQLNCPLYGTPIGYYK